LTERQLQSLRRAPVRHPGFPQLPPGMPPVRQAPEGRRARFCKLTEALSCAT